MVEDVGATNEEHGLSSVHEQKRIGGAVSAHVRIDALNHRVLARKRIDQGQVVRRRIRVESLCSFRARRLLLGAWMLLLGGRRCSPRLRCELPARCLTPSADVTLARDWRFRKRCGGGIAAS